MDMLQFVWTDIVEERTTDPLLVIFGGKGFLLFKKRVQSFLNLLRLSLCKPRRQVQRQGGWWGS